MAKWNESNRRWDADETLLSDAELAQCTRACDDDRFQTPIPTQMVSNGEYMPLPQSEQQKRVEMRVAQLAEGASKQLGLSRRGFLASVGGMAASFVAMNEVFGPYFKVDPLEMLVPEAYAAAASPQGSLRVRRSAASRAREPRQCVARAARSRAGCDGGLALQSLQQGQQAG